MSVSVETTRNDYSGSGTTGPFAYSFRIYDDDDLLVIVTDSNDIETVLTNNTDYTVSGVGDVSGGAVTLTSALETGYRLSILRAMDYLQEQAYTAGMAVTATSLNDALDKLEMQIQQVKERGDRALSLPKGSTLTGLEINPQANYVLGWDASAMNLQNYPTTEISVPVLDHIGNYSDSLSTAVSTIGSSNQHTLYINKSITIDTNTTVPNNINLVVPQGGRLDVESGVTLTINGAIEAGCYQIFSWTLPCQIVLGHRAAGVGVPGDWFGVVYDGITDDQQSWQMALNSMPDDGGVLIHTGGDSVVSSPLIWPVESTDATNCRAITLRGQSANSRSTRSYPRYNTSLFRYTGTTGALFDMRGGTSQNLIFHGALQNFHCVGPGSGTSTYGILIYAMQHAQLDTLSFHGFGYGIYATYRFYYAKMRGVSCRYNGVGAYFHGLFNGFTIDQCTFSSNDGNGLSILYGSQDVNINGGWFENNGGFGLYTTNTAQTTLNGSYFENNVGSHIYCSSTPFYNSSLGLIGVNFENSSTIYSVRLNNITSFSAINCSLLATSNGASSLHYAIYLEGMYPTGAIIGCRNPKLGALVSDATSKNLVIIDSAYPKLIHHYGSPAAYMANIQRGDLHLNADADRGTWGMFYTTPGAGSNATPLSGITATTSAGSKTVTLNAVTGIYPGTHITIAGETFGGIAFVKVRSIASTTSITLETAADVGVSGAAVAYNVAVRTNLTGMNLARTVHGTTATSGTGEDNLNSYVIPANAFADPWNLYQNGIEVLASGTKTGTAGNKTVKLKLGSSTICTIPAASGATDWSIEAKIFAANSASAQRSTVKAWDGAALVVHDHIETTEDNSSAITLLVTGECANAGDTITQRLWSVRSM